MIEISKFSDEMLVLDCGSVITFHSDVPCRFALNINNSSVVNVSILFHRDNSGKRDLYRSISDDNSSVIISSKHRADTPSFSYGEEARNLLSF